MAASKDGKSWRCQFYYKDWQGTRHKKNKRGFRTKAEAEQWERDFLQQHSGNLSIRFDNFVKIYMEDMKHAIEGAAILTAKDKGYQYAIGGFIKADKGHSGKY